MKGRYAKYYRNLWNSGNYPSILGSLQNFCLLFNSSSNSIKEGLGQENFIKVIHQI